MENYITSNKLTDYTTTIPIKKVYWNPPIRISASQITKEGTTKRRLRRNILNKIWNSIKCYFTELHTVGQEVEPLYDFYLEPKENGTLGEATPPESKHDEELITQVALAIHQTKPLTNLD